LWAVAGVGGRVAWMPQVQTRAPDERRGLGLSYVTGVSAEALVISAFGLVWRVTAEY
jgi:hypothetical protein